MDKEITIVGNPISIEELSEIIMRVQSGKEEGHNVNALLAEEVVRNLSSENYKLCDNNYNKI